MKSIKQLKIFAACISFLIVSMMIVFGLSLLPSETSARGDDSGQGTVFDPCAPRYQCVSIGDTDHCGVVPGGGPYQVCTSAGRNQETCVMVTPVCTPPVVAGVCSGSTYACAVGTVSGQGQNNSNYTYTWTCNGSGGGANASCTSPLPVAGQCGTTANTCNLGTPNNYGENNEYWTYTWNCQGINGGAAPSCSTPKPNQAPVVFAGTDITLRQPATSATVGDAQAFDR